MAETAVQLPETGARGGRGEDRRKDRGAARFGSFVRRHRITPYLLLVPALAGIILVYFWPLVQMVLYSFQNYGLPQITGAAPTQWVGFGNFATTFADSEFWLSLRITVVFAAVVVPLTRVLGRLVGLLLNRLAGRMSAFVSTAALLAWATPPVSGSVLFYWLFSPDGGLVDWALSKMPHWLVGSTNWAGFNWTSTGALQAYTVLTLLVVSVSLPLIAVTTLSGLKTVPAELYEAARIDGASPWRGFWRLTHPLRQAVFPVLRLLPGICGFHAFTQT